MSEKVENQTATEEVVEQKIDLKQAKAQIDSQKLMQ